MLIAFIVIIVLALIAGVALAEKAMELWVVVPYEKDRDEHARVVWKKRWVVVFYEKDRDRLAEVVWERRNQAKMLFCPSVFLLIFALDLNSLVDRGANYLDFLAIVLCLIFLVGLTALGFMAYKNLGKNPDRKEVEQTNVWIGISLYFAIIIMMILGNILGSTFLIPMHIGLAVLVTGMLMSKKTDETEFPGSEFIRAGIIFTIIGGLIFWHNYLGLNWF
jgi:hypothetical protein